MTRRATDPAPTAAELPELVAEASSRFLTLADE